MSGTPGQLSGASRARGQRRVTDDGAALYDDERTKAAALINCEDRHRAYNPGGRPLNQRAMMTTVRTTTAAMVSRYRCSEKRSNGVEILFAPNENCICTKWVVIEFR